jgi:3',5'-cyclic AMP phosphodiesterase CpdA
MKASATVRWGSMMLFCLVTVAGYGQSEFTSDVKSAPYPWTHTRFLETNDNFHFAIVSDRNGGCRPGIFDDAVAKLNLLRPSFVMSIGDFIEGYTDDVNALKPQWTKVESIIKDLQPPFFYVVGNHDYGEWPEPQKARDVREKLWQTLRGPTYYSFVYKNTLFLCLNSMGAENHHWGLGEKQLAWAKEVLAKNPKVRWTFIFLHAPLWKYDGDKSLEKGNETPQRFVELEKSLKGRGYTVFAGHTHQYTYCNRQGMKYFVLATTGGGSDLRGLACGEFDHILWVSMTDSGPKFINLELSGMLPDNVCTDASRNFGESIQFIPGVSDEKNKKSEFTLTFKNTFDSPMKISATWKNSALWSIQPKTISGTVQPGEVYSQKFQAEFKGTSWAVLPQLACRFNAGSFRLEQDVTLSRSCLGSIWADISSITARKASHAPEIDGKLDDALWKKPATVDDLIYPDLSGTAEPKTQTWFGYDDKNLYLACRCEEENMKEMIAKIHDRDGDVWTDDCIEFFLDTNLDRKTYYQFDVNSLGTVYDGTGIGQRNFNANVQVATSRDDKGWAVELAIPWKDLNVQPPVTGKKMGFEIARVRPGKGSQQNISQFPPLGVVFNHHPELFGLLTFGQ